MMGPANREAAMKGAMFFATGIIVGTMLQGATAQSPRTTAVNHVAIAVPDLEAASAIYRDTLGAKVSAPPALPDHGVTVVFIDTGN